MHVQTQVVPNEPLGPGRLRSMVALEVREKRIFLVFSRDRNSIIRLKHLNVVLSSAAIHLGMEELGVDITKPNTSEAGTLS